MVEEIWINIEGYENYKVSNLGSVKTLDYNHTGQEKLIKQFKNVRGYLACNLMENGIRKRVLIHRLLAIAFIPNPNNKATVNHINGIKTDNSLSNLEWNTIAENLKHAHRNGFIPYSKGENHYSNKYSNAKVLEIRLLLHNGTRPFEISKKLGIDIKYICHLKNKNIRKEALLCI